MRIWQTIATLCIAGGAIASTADLRQLKEIQQSKEIKKIELYHLRNKAKITGSKEGMYGDRILDGMDQVDNAMSTMLGHTVLDPKHPQLAEYRDITKELFQAKRLVHEIFGTHVVKSGKEHFIQGVTFDPSQSIDSIANLMNAIAELQKKETELIGKIGQNPATETRQKLIQILTRVRDRLQRMHNTEQVPRVKEHNKKLLDAVIALLGIAKAFDSLELYEEAKNIKRVGKLCPSAGAHLTALYGGALKGVEAPVPLPAPPVAPAIPSICANNSSTPLPPPPPPPPANIKNVSPKVPVAPVQPEGNKGAPKQPIPSPPPIPPPPPSTKKTNLSVISVQAPSSLTLSKESTSPVNTAKSKLEAQAKAVESARNDLQKELAKCEALSKHLSQTLEVIKNLKNALVSKSKVKKSPHLDRAKIALDETEEKLSNLSPSPHDQSQLEAAKERIKDAAAFAINSKQPLKDAKAHLAKGDKVIEGLKVSLDHLSRIGRDLQRNNQMHNDYLKLAEANLNMVNYHLNAYEKPLIDSTDKMQANSMKTQAKQISKELGAHNAAPSQPSTPAASIPKPPEPELSSLEASKQELGEKIAILQKQEDNKRKEAGQIPELERIKRAIRSGKLADTQMKDIIAKNLHVLEHDNIKVHQVNLDNALYILEEYVKMLEQYQATLPKPSAAVVAESEAAIKSLDTLKMRTQEQIQNLNQEIEKRKIQDIHLVAHTPQEAIDKIRQIEEYLKGLISVSPSPQAEAALNEIEQSVEALNMCNEGKKASTLPPAPIKSDTDLHVELKKAQKHLESLIESYRIGKAKFCKENPTHERCKPATAPSTSTNPIISTAENLQNALKEDIITHPNAADNSDKVVQIAKLKAEVDALKKVDPVLKADVLPKHKYNPELTQMKEAIKMYAAYVKNLASKLGTPQAGTRVESKLYDLASNIKTKTPNSQIQSAANKLQSSLDPSVKKVIAQKNVNLDEYGRILTEKMLHEEELLALNFDPHKAESQTIIKDLVKKRLMKSTSSHKASALKKLDVKENIYV